MNIAIDMSIVVTIWLVFVRISALLLLTPLFAVAQVPVRIRIILFLSLSAVLVMSAVISPITTPLSTGSLILASAHELFIGALMAFGLFAAFGAFLFGGRMLDFQMGFGVAHLIDPSTNLQSPMIGTFLNMLAVTIFFTIDGHHMLIKGLLYSFQQLPIGYGLSDFTIGPIVAQFGLMFVYGFMLVAPAVLALFFIDMGMAIAARTMPQVNMFIVGLPLKIFVGLVILAISLNYITPLIKRIFTSIFEYWELIFP